MPSCCADGKQVRGEELHVTSGGHPALGLIEDPGPLLNGVSSTAPHLGLRLYFDYFTSIVPFNSWNELMRQMGLEDNDIRVARARALDPREALYEMLVTWLSKAGKAASVNTLLDALETLRERNAVESIQNHLVGSGRYGYDEDEGSR